MQTCLLDLIRITGTLQYLGGTTLETGRRWDAGFKPNFDRRPNRSVFSVVFFKPWIPLPKYGWGSARKTLTEVTLSRAYIPRVENRPSYTTPYNLDSHKIKKKSLEGIKNFFSFKDFLTMFQNGRYGMFSIYDLHFTYLLLISFFL